jgi:hypothetical protein
MSVDDDKSDSVRDEFLSGKKRARAIRIWSTRSFAEYTR